MNEQPHLEAYDMTDIPAIDYRFRFVPLDAYPMLDAAPHHLRMASCYQDRRGNYHVFVDFIDAAQRTRDSWRAEVRHYVGGDLRNWRFEQIATRPGKHGETDSYGTNSPHIMPYDGRAYLFYCGHNVAVPGEGFNPGGGPGDAGWMTGVIQVAVAPLDDQGAPHGPFVKHGVIIDMDPEWANSRLGDPYALVHDGYWWVYHKARHRTSDGTNLVQAALQRSPVGTFAFEPVAVPALELPGGGELCRVFRYRDLWHLFVTQWDLSDGGTLWRHHVSTDLVHWTCVNPHLFDTAKPHRESAPDLSIVVDADGRVAEPLTAVCTGRDERDGILKLYAYRIEEE